MELSLDLSLAFVPRTISEFLGDVSQNKDGSQKMTIFEDLIKRLEDEKRKIEAFKRELPLCMILVKDAITRLKEEINGCTRMQDKPVVEELMPLMNTNSEGNSDKKYWMSSAQLSSAETDLWQRKGEDDHRSVPHNSIQPWNETNKSGGAFLAFNGNSCVSKTVIRDDKEVSKVSSFGLMAPTFELNHRNPRSPVEIKGQPLEPQDQRKQRRCWSPELHRRFVDALQRLGGPQVATPKQIRELMQVEGLTNDEVKSHLQKYRLHFRRISVPPVGQANKRESKGNLTQSVSPQGPLFLGGSTKGFSSSGLNSMDTEEDEQSDCHSWKGGSHQQPEAGILFLNRSQASIEIGSDEKIRMERL